MKNAMLSDLSVLLILVIFSAFFSGSEVALFSLSKSRLLRFSSSHEKSEKMIAALMQDPRKILVTILIGNLLANMLISALSAKMMLDIWGKYGHFVAIAVVTPLIIILCDITPKTITRSDPEGFSRFAVFILGFFHKIFMPVRVMLLEINNGIIRLFGLGRSDEGVITEEDLDVAIRMGERDGVIGMEEAVFIKNVMRFSKKEAQNIMIPRNQAVFISHDASIEDASKIFLETGLVRALVYKKNYDTVVGVLDSRDLLPYLWGYKKSKSIGRLLYTVYHYPASKELGELLEDFLKNKIQIAVVVDEYGGTAGVVTLNGILSELMGHEFSAFEESYRPGVRRVGDEISIIAGDLQIDDFNILFHDNLTSSESETVGGYIIEKIGHFPERDTVVATERHILRVKKIVKNRISSVEVAERTEKR